MNRTKEISLGLIWGALAALLIMLFIFVEGKAANTGTDGGEIEITISADSVHFELDKDGSIKSVTVGKDRFEKTSSGIRIEDEIIIENGRVFIDGVEITEGELDRLAVDSEYSVPYIGWTEGGHKNRYVKRERLATVYMDTVDDVVKFSDIVIRNDEHVTGDVVSLCGDVDIYGLVDGDVAVLSGDLCVYGEVSGDAVAVFGDVYLEDCYVGGDVAAPFGEVFREEGVTVRGDITTTKNGGVYINGVYMTGLGFTVRYNRVEGLGVFSTLDYDDREKRHPSVDLFGGYAFTLKRWEYDFGISHRFFDGWSPYIDVSMFQLAESSDKWILTEPENSIAAALLKEDFYDFYWKRGFSGEIGLSYKGDFAAGVGYSAAKIQNLKRTASKALFGGKKEFRENWSTVLYDTLAVAGIDGKLKEIEFKASYDTRDYKEDPESGIFTNLVYRQALDSDSADFDYETMDAELKYYFPMATDQTLFFRFRGGYSDDDLPLFRRYFIGGIGSLRGYEYKEFQGNRYILFNADYIWRFFDSSFGAGVFFDAGKAAFSGTEFEDEDLYTDIGIAFLVGEDFRINLAQRLDDMDKSPVLSLRGKILF